MLIIAEKINFYSAIKVAVIIWVQGGGITLIRFARKLGGSQLFLALEMGLSAGEDVGGLGSEQGAGGPQPRQGPGVFALDRVQAGFA